MPKQHDPWDPRTPIEANHYNWTCAPEVLPPLNSPADGKPSAVDLFSGCGGFSEGLRGAGFQSVFSIDIHRPSVDTYRRNHPTATTALGDIRRITDSQIETSISSSTVAVITAGVPCQGFSLCNRKRWDKDDRNFLFREFIRVVRLLSPQFVILENVAGLRTAANGDFVRAIATSIQESGYQVECSVLNAAHFGVPQTRQRVFFVGAKKGLEIRWPAPTHAKRYVSVWEAIGDLPQIGPGECASSYEVGPQTAYQRQMRKGCNELHNHEAPSHPPSVILKIQQTPPGSPIYPRFKQRIRLHPEMPSPTQVSGGIRPQYQFGHPTLPRGLTVRERCRLQSFPDRYYISGGIVQGRVQTGNAVPPLLAQALAEQIMGVLRGEPRSKSALPRSRTQMELFA